MNRKNRTAFLLPLLLASSLPASALQILEAKDGDTVLARISQKEVTRIAFERSRIRKVTGNSGEFVMEKDEDRGQIYIRPTASDATKPINLFVSSDRGTVALLLQPIDGPSDTLIIREPRVPSTPSSSPERAQAHVRAVKNLMLAMANDTTPEDMEVRTATRELALWPGVQLTLDRAYVGVSLVGERFFLSNIGTTEIEIDAQALYKRGVMAIAVETGLLRPGDMTNVFVIRERYGHD